jgi:hypothetical protein
MFDVLTMSAEEHGVSEEVLAIAEPGLTAIAAEVLNNMLESGTTAAFHPKRRYSSKSIIRHSDVHGRNSWIG